ncbi:ABC transporter substrate-binding protein, partial [Desulfovibrio inopinatus]|uniref:ABC transporter substrate-binding protein n=1 Tax=Desulfovibrio inopinatus TaxID=102109 RepID=UPI000412B942
MKTLDELIFSVSAMAEETTPASGKLDLLLYAPCPVKLAVKEGIDAIVRQSKDDGPPLSVHIPMGCTSVDPVDPLYRETDPDRLPDMIASIGFGDFFRQEFADHFVKAGFFEAILPDYVEPMHEQAGIIDPAGHYVIYGLTPYIFLVDMKRLGDVPPPTQWSDLLDPRYRGHINMCGDGDDMADAVLINYYKEYGWEGIERFAENVYGLMHSSHMGKSGGVSNAGGIYIIPYFFAESSKHPDHMRVIWPEDGAAASPLYFLVKKSEAERLKPLVSFLNSGFGQIESARWFLPLSGPLPEGLDKNARIKWVGWDFIAERDITTVRDELNDRFRKLVQVK